MFRMEDFQAETGIKNFPKANQNRWNLRPRLRWYPTEKQYIYSSYFITFENLYGHFVYKSYPTQQIQTRTEYRQCCMKDACCMKSHPQDLREYIRWLSLFRSLSYDRPKVFSTSSWPQSVMCFLFKFPVSSCFLQVKQQLLTSSSSCTRNFQSSVCPSFNKMFQKAVSTQLLTNPVSLLSLYCTQDIPFLPDSLLHLFIFTRSAKFKKFPGITELFPEMFNI